MTTKKDPSCYSCGKIDRVYLVVVDPTKKSCKILEYDPLEYHNILSSLNDDFDSYEIR